MAEDGKSMKSSGKAEGVVNDHCTLEIPKSLLSLHDAEAANFMRKMITPDY